MDQQPIMNLPNNVHQYASSLQGLEEGFHNNVEDAVYNSVAKLEDHLRTGLTDKLKRTTRPHIVSQENNMTEFPMAIIPDGYPYVSVTTQQAHILEQFIMQQVIAFRENRQAPKITKVVFTGDYLVVICADLFSSNWLVRTITGCQLWLSSGIKVLNEKDMSKYVWRMMVLIPGPTIPVETILKRFQTQNMGINTDKWKVMHIVLGDASQRLFIAMDKPSWLELALVKCRLHINFIQVQFHVIEEKQWKYFWLHNMNKFNESWWKENVDHMVVTDQLQPVIQTDNLIDQDVVVLGEDAHVIGEQNSLAVQQEFKSSEKLWEHAFKYISKPLWLILEQKFKNAIIPDELWSGNAPPMKRRKKDKGSENLVTSSNSIEDVIFIGDFTELKQKSLYCVPTEKGKAPSRKIVKPNIVIEDPVEILSTDEDEPEVVHSKNKVHTDMEHTRKVVKPNVVHTEKDVTIIELDSEVVKQKVVSRKKVKPIVKNNVVHSKQLKTTPVVCKDMIYISDEDDDPILLTKKATIANKNVKRNVANSAKDVLSTQELNKVRTEEVIEVDMSEQVETTHMICEDTLLISDEDEDEDDKPNMVPLEQEVRSNPVKSRINSEEECNLNTTLLRQEVEPNIMEVGDKPIVDHSELTVTTSVQLEEETELCTVTSAEQELKPNIANSEAAIFDNSEQNVISNLIHTKQIVHPNVELDDTMVLNRVHIKLEEEMELSMVSSTKQDLKPKMNELEEKTMPTLVRSEIIPNVVHTEEEELPILIKSKQLLQPDNTLKDQVGLNKIPPEQVVQPSIQRLEDCLMSSVEPTGDEMKQNMVLNDIENECNRDVTISNVGQEKNMETKKIQHSQPDEVSKQITQLLQPDNILKEQVGLNKLPPEQVVQPSIQRLEERAMSPVEPTGDEMKQNMVSNDVGNECNRDVTISIVGQANNMEAKKVQHSQPDGVSKRITRSSKRSLEKMCADQMGIEPSSSDSCKQSDTPVPSTEKKLKPRIRLHSETVKKLDEVSPKQVRKSVVVKSPRKKTR